VSNWFRWIRNVGAFACHRVLILIGFCARSLAYTRKNSDLKFLVVSNIDLNIANLDSLVDRLVVVVVAIGFHQFETFQDMRLVEYQIEFQFTVRSSELSQCELMASHHLNVGNWR
jgi:hypothetical protein